MLIFIFCNPVFTLEKVKGIVTSLNPGVNIKEHKTGKWQLCDTNTKIYDNTRIYTDKKGFLDVLLKDKSVIHIDNNSAISLSAYKKNKSVNSVEVSEWSILVDVPKTSDKKLKFVIKTPISVLGVRGTIFVVKHEEDTTNVAVFKGKIIVQNVSDDTSVLIKKVEVNEKQQNIIVKDNQPAIPIPINKQMEEFYQTQIKEFVSRAEYYRVNMENYFQEKSQQMEDDYKKYEK